MKWLSPAERFRWGLVLITLLGAYFRFRGVFANTFHADEALFGMWARYIAVWRDPLLFDVPTPVDKPPLLFYLQAIFYPLQGPVEWAARLPNFFASLLLIPLVGRMGSRLTGGNRLSGWLAAVFVAFSPLAIQFSATAFTDPLLTFLLTVALWHAIRPDDVPSVWRSAGLWLGLALLTKYQAALFLPLVLWLERTDLKRCFRTLLLFGGCAALLLLWDWIPNGQIDLFGRQISAYGGIRFIGLSDLYLRLSGYLWLCVYVLGWAGSLLAVFLSVWRKRPTSLLFMLFIAAYLLLHVVLKTLIEPRYLLPLVPLTALAVTGLPSLPQFKPAHRWMGVLAAVLLLLQALPARSGAYSLGGRPENDDGAAAIAQTILDEPYGTVLYDHWYSWHWRYHFFYKGVYVEWFGDVDDLLENLNAFYDPTAEQSRYLALRQHDPLSADIQTALQAAGYRLEPKAAAGRITLYEIQHEVKDE